jgi:hypothetical protein
MAENACTSEFAYRQKKSYGSIAGLTGAAVYC